MIINKEMRMKSRTIFAVDVDDVVLDLVPMWLYVYNTIYNDSVNPKDIKTWDIVNYTKLANKPDKFYSLLNESLYRRLFLVEGASEAISELRGLGRVIFVTSNFGDVGRPKFEALNRLGIPVNKSDFIETGDKSVIRGDYLIDDNFGNATNFKGVGLLFNRPWNQDYEYHLRFGSWDKILKFIRFAEGIQS